MSSLCEIYNFFHKFFWRQTTHATKPKTHFKIKINIIDETIYDYFWWNDWWKRN